MKNSACYFYIYSDTVLDQINTQTEENVLQITKEVIGKQSGNLSDASTQTEDDLNKVTKEHLQQSNQNKSFIDTSSQTEETTNMDPLTTDISELRKLAFNLGKTQRQSILKDVSKSTKAYKSFEGNWKKSVRVNIKISLTDMFMKLYNCSVE